MSQSTSSRKRSSAAGLSSSGCGDSTRKSKSSYDANFRQNMIDSGIYPHDRHSKPANIGSIRDQLPTYRASLSPSRFDDAEFDSFTDLNEREASETRAMADVLTTIEGKGRHKYHSDGPDRPFNHLEPLSEWLPTPKPDLYDGILHEAIGRHVRQGLARHIMPCNESSRPAVPNFFVEGKSAGGRADVAKLQACHDGAVGARAIHSLQNYGAPKSLYDSNINSYSTTYHPGTATLQLYGHHMTAPHAPLGSAQYHMTQMGSYAMTHNSQRFREGATAFRNLRDLAQSHRNSFVEEANSAARHAPSPSPSTTSTESGRTRSQVYDEQSDTSVDELTAEESTAKRHRHV